MVHVTPSGLVITRLPEPLTETATNVSWPTGPPQVIPSHWLATGTVLGVQLMPSVLVIT